MSNGRMCLTVGVLVSLLAPRALPAPAQAPCAAPAHRQFDFWIGDWDGYDVGDALVRPHER